MAWCLSPPQDALTVVVKASWRLQKDGSCERLDEPVAPMGDLVEDDGSLRHASELAPYKPRAEVLMHGSAYPAHGSRAVRRVVLQVGRLQKEVVALGPRRWEGQAPGEPQSFDVIPLTFASAFGGIDFAANPVGRGIDGRLPLLERPDALIHRRDDRPAPACFAPIAPGWLARASKMGRAYGDDYVEERWPYHAADFDPAYFNAAPADQWLNPLRGDEDFSLTGVHPDADIIAGRLPAVAPQVRLLRELPTTDEPAWQPLPMTLDTLVFDLVDPQAMVLTLVWRGAIEVSAEHAPEIEEIYVADDTLTAPRDDAALWLAYRQRKHPGDKPVVLGPTPASNPPLIRDAALALIAAGGAGAMLAGCDLAEADLSGRDLSGAVLTDANLTGANLTGADLTGAILARARAVGTTFARANLRGAHLGAAVLTDASFVDADLTQANLADVEASAADFSGAVATAARFTDAGLVGARFDRARGVGADFSGSGLDGASFREVELTDAQFYDVRATGADCEAAVMTQLRADGATLERACFVGAQLEGASFALARLEAARLSGAQLGGCVFNQAQLTRAVLATAHARGARFRLADLSEAKAAGADFMEASFESASLKNADMRGCNLYAAETWKADTSGLELEGAQLAGTKLVSS